MFRPCLFCVTGRGFLAEGLYLILVNVRVCSYDDSLLNASLRRSAFHHLADGRKNVTDRRENRNEVNKERASAADLWDVSGCGGDRGAAGGLWGYGLGAGHSCAVFIVCPIISHLRKKKKKKTPKKVSRESIFR